MAALVLSPAHARDDAIMEQTSVTIEPVNPANDQMIASKSGDAAEVEPLDDVVGLQLVDRGGRHRDFAMDDDVAAVGNSDGLVEILLRHQHRQPDPLFQLA